MPASSSIVTDQRGAAAVEFALILPLLVMLVFGIIEFGIALNTKLTLTHAAREGARAEIVGDDPKAAVIDAATSVVLKPSDIEVTPCDDDVDGEKASVKASTKVDLSIPFTDLGEITLSSKAVMRCQ